MPKKQTSVKVKKESVELRISVEKPVGKTNRAVEADIRKLLSGVYFKVKVQCI